MLSNIQVLQKALKRTYKKIIQNYLHCWLTTDENGHVAFNDVEAV